MTTASFWKPKFTSWFFVGNKGVYYVGIIFLYSLLRTSKFMREKGPDLDEAFIAT